LEKEMSWFQDLSIRGRVMAAFGTVLAVTVLLGGYSINRISSVNDGAGTGASASTGAVANLALSSARDLIHQSRATRDPAQNVLTQMKAA
jgi:hypothetical protein